MRLIRYMLFVMLAASVQAHGIFGTAKPITAAHTQGHDLTQVWGNAKLVWSSAAPEPPAWTPNSIANCALWLDASDVTTLAMTGTAVHAWSDKSANGYNFTSTLLKRPAYVESGMNSLGSLEFDGTSDTMYGPNLGLGASSSTIFAVVRADAVSAENVYRMVFAFGQFNTGLFMARRTHPTVYRAESYNNAQGVIGNDATMPNTPQTDYLMCLVRDKTAVMYYKQDSVRMKDTGAVPADYAGGIVQIGYMDAGLVSAKQWDGQINEILVYGRVLTSNEIVTVESYLNTKWSIY